MDVISEQKQPVSVARCALTSDPWLKMTVAVQVQTGRSEALQWHKINAVHI